MLKLKRRPATAKASKIDRPDYFGSASPDIVFVIDPMVGQQGEDEAPKPKRPINSKQLDFLSDYCSRYNIPISKAGILRACPPVTAEQWDSDKRITDHRKLNRDEFVNVITDLKPKVIVCMGKTSASQTLNRSAKITQVRGTPTYSEEFDCLVFPMLGLAHVIRIPDVEPVFNADIATLQKIVEAGYALEYQDEVAKDYKWITDLAFLVKNPPKAISLDCETLGNRWYDPTSRVLTVQITTSAGQAYAVPIDYNHLYKGVRDPLKVWTKPKCPVTRMKLVAQLKILLENPSIEVFGQNLKFDFLMLREKLGISIANYRDDTILLSHALDENLKQRNIDELTRLYVPALSGYADDFNRDPVHRKKSRMDLVPPDKMLYYGCGDTDAAWRLRDVFLEELAKDKKALNCYRRVVMPANRAFCDVETYGFPVDKEALRRFEKELRAHQKKEYNSIFRSIPKVIRDEFVTKDKKWRASITRPGFLIQMLFLHPKGLRLKPKVFTKSTKNLKDVDARTPSVSTKDHLPYFEDHTFVASIIKYIKNEKLLGTYVGTEGEDDDGGSVKGFYKYIVDGFIRPTYLLFATTTGRSASRDPNGQNFPKHGELAKRYREIFVALPGWCLLEVDFSQIELRIAAIAAREPTMLRLYREGADIHAMTAAAVMGISLEEFNKLDPKIKGHKRFQAKAVNFGFLYGMGWRKFIVYAKTQYGIEFTEEEAQEIRKTFFRLYRGLKPWHDGVKEYARENGYVRAFDGRVRHLPSIGSPDEGVAAQAERQAVNSPVQGFASDLGLMAIRLILDRVSRGLVIPIGFIHDAIVCMVPEDRAKEGAGIVKKIMQTIPLEKWFGFKSPIPIIAEASIGKNLSDMIEIPDDWYSDNDIKTYYDIQIKDWQNRCVKAERDGKPRPPRPSRSNEKRTSQKTRLQLKSKNTEQNLCHASSRRKPLRLNRKLSTSSVKSSRTAPSSGLRLKLKNTGGS